MIETNASGEGIGAMLMQDQHPITFISKALAPKHRGLSLTSGTIVYLSDTL